MRTSTRHSSKLVAVDLPGGHSRAAVILAWLVGPWSPGWKDEMSELAREIGPFSPIDLVFKFGLSLTLDNIYAYGGVIGESIEFVKQFVKGRGIPKEPISADTNSFLERSRSHWEDNRRAGQRRQRARRDWAEMFLDRFRNR